MRPELELADIFRQYGVAYRQAHAAALGRTRLSSRHPVDAMSALEERRYARLNGSQGEGFRTPAIAGRSSGTGRRTETAQARIRGDQPTLWGFEDSDTHVQVTRQLPSGAG
jgi:hypothetical protein